MFIVNNVPREILEQAKINLKSALADLYHVITTLHKKFFLDKKTQIRG